MEKNKEITIKSGINLSGNIRDSIEELRNMSNEEVDTLMRNTVPPLVTNFNPLANFSNEELEDESLKYLKNLYDKRLLTLRKYSGNKYKEENQNPEFTKENLQILSNEIDKYFLNKKTGTLSESNITKIEEILRKARKYGSIPTKILDNDENMSYPIIKPFFEEKYIPTEREFKDEAKKLKVSGNFSSLGAAQNALAKKYGFEEYRAIKSKFSESSMSYDNINTIIQKGKND